MVIKVGLISLKHFFFVLLKFGNAILIENACPTGAIEYIFNITMSQLST